MAHEAAIKAALGVMQDHIEGLNARDEAMIAATLHFPHIRLSTGGMKVWETSESYFTDFRARAGSGWHRSSFEDIRVLQASDNKVHLDAEIWRYGEGGAVYQTFRSLWVITLQNGRWAAQMRSSFAPR